MRRPLEFMVSLRSYGDVVTIYLGSLPVYVLTDSALAYQVLAVEADHFGKGVFFEKFRPYFGNGLVLSSGELYRRQRRLVQPSFHRERIARYAETMIDLASVMAESWRPGQIVAFDDRMQDLALAILGRTLFATEPGRQAVEEVRRSIPIMLNDGLVRVFSPKVVERLPIPGNRRFNDAIVRLRHVVDDVVKQARADGGDRGDVLSMLLLARDEDTGERMSDQQVHDEVVALLTAGGETSAITLAWLFHEIARHPEVERRLHAEVDAVLADRRVTVADLPKLTYTRQVINEVLRVHAPWLLMRRAHRCRPRRGAPADRGRGGSEPARAAPRPSSAQALRRQEGPYFSAAARLEAYLFPGGYGHSFNYAPNADEFYRTVGQWADRMVWPLTLSRHGRLLGYGLLGRALGHGWR